MLHSSTHSEPRFLNINATVTCNTETLKFVSLLFPNILAFDPIKRPCLLVALWFPVILLHQIIFKWVKSYPAFCNKEGKMSKHLHGLRKICVEGFIYFPILNISYITFILWSTGGPQPLHLEAFYTALWHFKSNQSTTIAVAAALVMCTLAIAKTGFLSCNRTSGFLPSAASWLGKPKKN